MGKKKKKGELSTRVAPAHVWMVRMMVRERRSEEENLERRETTDHHAAGASLSVPLGELFEQISAKIQISSWMLRASDLLGQTPYDLATYQPLPPASFLLHTHIFCFLNGCRPMTKEPAPPHPH